MAGWINAVAPDGRGGWYVGGVITGAGGQSRSGLAHITAAGDVSDWAPNCDGQVYAIAVHAGVVYVGGAFATVGDSSRSNLAAVDAATGVTRGWNPGASAPVYALLPLDTTIVVGGEFLNLGGLPRRTLARVSLRTGLPTDWDPNSPGTGFAGVIRTMTRRGDTLYVAGLFGRIGTESREYLGALSLTSGLATDWHPGVIAGSGDRYDGAPYVASIVAAESTIYVAGHFKSIGGVAREGLAELDAFTGNLMDWDPRLGPEYPLLSPYVASIALAESTVYVAGNKEAVGGVERYYVAEVDRTTARATLWNPRANYIASVVALAGDRVFVGGHFGSIGPEWQPRRGITVLNATDGKLDDWGPIENDAYGMVGVVPYKGRIYIAGNFSLIQGQVRWFIAALDSATGRVLDWAPHLNSYPSQMKRFGDRLYVSGEFTSVGGVPRNGMASFDLETGALTDWNPQIVSYVSDFDMSGDVVYLATVIRGAHGIPVDFAAAVSAATGEQLPWSPEVSTSVTAIVATDSLVYLGGPFASVGQEPRFGFAVVNARNGKPHPWRADAMLTPTRTGRCWAFCPVGDTVFVAGSFRTFGGKPRGGFAAFRASTGEVLDWDPHATGYTHNWPVSPGIGFGLLASEGTLYIGGGFEQLGPLPAGGLAVLPLGGSGSPAPPPPHRPALSMIRMIAPNPLSRDATISLLLPASGEVSLSVFDLQGRRVVDLMRKLELPAGPIEVPLDAHAWREGVYFCRLEAGGRIATRRLTVLR